jgi:hypothetical protein
VKHAVNTRKTDSAAEQRRDDRKKHSRGKCPLSVFDNRSTQIL